MNISFGDVVSETADIKYHPQNIQTGGSRSERAPIGRFSGS